MPFSLNPLKNFFLREPKQKNFLVLDIGSDYIKALAFELTDEGRAAVIGIGTHPLKLSDTKSGVIADIGSVTEAADLAVEKAKLSCNASVKDVIVGVSGLLTRGISTTVRLNRSDPERQINESELDEIISKIEKAAYLEATKQMGSGGQKDIEIELTNSAITSVKIDGYFVTNPVGFKGKQMEISLFTAFSPSNHLSVIQGICKDLSLNLKTISSGLYALTSALTVYEPTEFNALLLDVGGDTTDIGLVFGGGIISTKSINIGGRHFTRKIKDDLSLSFSEAEARKISYSEGKLTEEEGENIKSAIKSVSDLLVSGIEVVLADFGGVKAFPSKIYLTGGGSSLSEVKLRLSEGPWSRNIPFKSHPSVESLSLFNLTKIEDRTGKLDSKELIIPASLGMIGLEMFT